MSYSSDFSHPEKKKKKKKELIRGTQICTMVLKYLPVKLRSSSIKGNNL